jgi:hypothetical protein
MYKLLTAVFRVAKVPSRVRKKGLAWENPAWSFRTLHEKMASFLPSFIFSPSGRDKREGAGCGNPFPQPAGARWILRELETAADAPDYRSAPAQIDLTS